MIFNQTYVRPPYAPLIWNDTGKYNYFYIDFKKTLAPFSMGMFIESSLVYGTAPITVTALEKVNTTTYKVYANITGLLHGVTVMSKSPTRLKLASGKELPAFSTFAFITGVSSYIDGGYFYEITQRVEVSSFASAIIDTLIELSLHPSSTITPVYESISIFSKWAPVSITETTTVVLL